MKITHFNGKEAISKNVDYPVAFILVNDHKDFVTFYDIPQSRYEGFFVAHGDTFIKTVSRLVRSGNVDGVELYHGKTLAAFRYSKDTVINSIAQDEPVLIYESLNKESLIMRLDIRDQFYIPQWGRYYNFYENGKAVVVRYSDDHLIEPVFIAILHDGDFNPLGRWIPVEYERDKQRNSNPTILYEYDLGEFTAKKLILAFGTSEDEALERAERYKIFTQVHALSDKQIKPKQINKKPDTTAKKFAQAYAQNALNELFIEDRMLAGMPWFTKAWVRDELISLPAFPESKAHAVLSKYINADWYDGRLPVIFGGSNFCSDGVGLLAWAIIFGQFALSTEERQVLSDKLATAINALEHTENEYGFVPSNERESWMDSIGRVGYPIETQALYSKIIQLAYLLTGSNYYKTKRLKLIENIRERYFVDGYLHDRLNDETIRPNIFLATFFAPEILSKAEWEQCFDKVLPTLWLNWGGLASIDTRHEYFCDISAGEYDTSYHNGDSWFFVNNIAALVLHNMNKTKYKSYVDAIINGSTSEVLWHNYIGQPGEISSAQALESWGCGLQGFSAAAYVYLTKHISLRRHTLKDLFFLPPKVQVK